MSKYFIKDVLLQTVATTVIVALAFVIVEPAAINSATAEDTFIVSQSITSEIAFQTAATDITMTPSLAAITGGTSNGSTTVSVTTNNALGYTLSLTASSSVGMIGASQGGNIPAYVHSTGSTTPEFTFTTPANKAYFGYTVENASTSDLAAGFKDNGSLCGTGVLDTANSCWVNASTSAKTLVNRSTFTSALGATTTVKFRVVINSNPSPSIPQDTYFATATLTAVTN